MTNDVAEDCCLWTVSVCLTQEKILHLTLTTLVKRSEKPLCFHVVMNDVCFFRFTPGAAAQLEQRRTGPSQADVEAIKVHFFTLNVATVEVCIAHTEIKSISLSFRM